MRKGFLLYEEMSKYFPILEEALSHIWLCNCSILNFLMRKILFSFFSVQLGRRGVGPALLSHWQEPSRCNKIHHANVLKCSNLCLECFVHIAYIFCVKNNHRDNYLSHISPMQSISYSTRSMFKEYVNFPHRFKMWYHASVSATRPQFCHTQNGWDHEKSSNTRFKLSRAQLSTSDGLSDSLCLSSTLTLPVIICFPSSSLLSKYLFSLPFCLHFFPSAPPLLKSKYT